MGLSVAQTAEKIGFNNPAAIFSVEDFSEQDTRSSENLNPDFDIFYTDS